MSRLNTHMTALVTVAALAGAMILGATSFSFAQNYGAPPDNIGGGGDSQGNGGNAPDAAGGGSDASLIVRVERLEDQIRQMTGQVQQMQFENRQLQDQLKKFEQDVDFRLQDSRGGHPHHSEMTPASPPSATDADSGPTPSDAAADSDSADANAPTDTPATDTPPRDTPLRHGRGGDAFDPSADPNAPGAPKPLGSGESSPPPVADTASGAANNDPNAPLNLQSAYTPPAPSLPAGGVSTPAGTELASTQPASPREEFDAALGYFKQKDYDNAEHGFHAFLEKNPKSHLTAEALYLLGESYSARGQAREAAEQFLKISTAYSASSRAPEAMLRLGESLHALGNKDEACAAFGEVPHKYPNAAVAVKAAAREAQREKCGA